MNVLGDAPPENDVVRWTADAIVDRSADGVTWVVAGVAAHALAGGLPAVALGGHRELRTGLDLIREAGAENAIDRAVDVAKGRVSKLVGMGLKRAGQLLVRVADGRLEGVADRASGVLSEWAARTQSVDSILGELMAIVYSEDHVVRRSSNILCPLDGRTQRQRERRLWKLRDSNERWIKPVRYLAYGLGPLWLVPLPVPVAPIAAAMMLVWVILISGDQMDAGGPFPGFWKGVVQRSDGA